MAYKHNDLLKRSDKTTVQMLYFSRLSRSIVTLSKESVTVNNHYVCIIFQTTEPANEDM